MIEFITPKMYGLDDTLTKPGYGADAKAVGDALAAIEVGGGGGAAPDLTGYATEEYVDNAIAAIPKTDLSEYAKTEDIPSIEGLATETYVDDAIAQAQLSGGDIDLSEYAKKSDIPDTSGFIKEIPGEYITETELNDYRYATEDFVIDWVANNAGGGSGGSDCGIYVWPSSVLRISEMSTGVYTLQNAEVYYQDDTTEFGGEEPAKSITIDYGVLTVKTPDMVEDGALHQFTIVSGEEIYKGYSVVIDATEDGLGILATSGEITATLNMVENFSEVEEDAEYSTIASVGSVKSYLNKEGYIKQGSSVLSQFTTEAEVIALIEANMPASAEEVEY
jgi:hypothetical protein